jgi:hypothetical protein
VATWKNRRLDGYRQYGKKIMKPLKFNETTNYKKQPCWKLVFFNCNSSWRKEKSGLELILFWIVRKLQTEK